MADNDTTLDNTLQREDSEDEDHQIQEEEENIPSELLKSYHFGIGPFRPKWLQVLANRKIFTLFLCVFAVLEGAIVSGMTSVIVSTIEKRYHLTNTEAGFIPVAFDVAVTISVVFVSYFGGRGHKPRCLGICMIIMGIGCLVFASPQLLLGPYNVGDNSVSSYLHEVCNDNRTYTKDCTTANSIAYTLFLFGKVLLGIGASPLYTVAQAYLDDIVRPRYITVYMGIYHTMGIVGPVIGYGIGSGFLSVYVDPWTTTSLTTTDPAWVGAWWISFVIVGLLSFVAAVPFLMFPRYLSDSQYIYLERSKEMAKVYNNSSSNLSLKMFPVHIKRLLFNPSFMFCSFSLGGLYLLTNGLVVFGPQYVENIFYLSPTRAGLISGAISVVVAVCGVLTGSLIMYCFKIKGRRIMLFCFIIALITVPIVLGLLVHCPTTSVVGINYPNSTINDIDFPSCANECNCVSHVYEPVCGADGLTYFSPCRAGCAVDNNNDNTFSNCSCVGSEEGSTARLGKCDINCHLLIPFIIGVSIVLGMEFLLQIPIYYFTIRVVSDESRSLALGVQSVIWRSVGAIPGPVITGAIFDASCLFWEESCGRRGNCWIYNSTKLSTGVTFFIMPVMGIVSVLFLLSCLTFKKEETEWYIKLTGYFKKEKLEDDNELIIDNNNN